MNVWKDARRGLELEFGIKLMNYMYVDLYVRLAKTDFFGRSGREEYGVEKTV